MAVTDKESRSMPDRKSDKDVVAEDGDQRDDVAVVEEPPADTGTSAAESETMPADSEPVPEPVTPLGPYTTLSEFLRDSVLVPAGTVVTFLEHEVGHIHELLANRALHPGAGPDAQAAVDAAESEREAARNTPPV